ncbi:MAG: FMN-binding protein [Firmicutes bacterium]|nr:FMN-binding protein [Bacillota bacterium]
MDEEKYAKETLLTLLIAAVILIFASYFLSRFGEKRTEAFEEALREQLRGSDPTSQVVETTAEGYVDEIVVWTAVKPDGRIAGVTIRTMHETPGIGRRALREEGFLRQFLGTRGDAEIGSNVDGISGATVTSRAVARAINAASASITGEDAVTEATTWGKGGEAYE